MKKIKTLLIIAVLIVLLPVGFSACLKDKCRGVRQYTWYEPVYRSKSEVRADIKSHQPTSLVNTGKIYLYGNYIFLNEVDKGIHVIDNSNPSQPRNVSFIAIPGNVDIAVRNNILYADLYADLVAIDVSNPTNVTLKKIINGIFPERAYINGFMPDSSRVIVDWIRHDSTISGSCDGSGYPPIYRGGPTFVASTLTNASATAASPVGMGGSMARFTIVNDYMYAVERHTLKYISLVDPANPILAGDIFAGYDIETIFPFQNKLFLGSMVGMFIYDISDPTHPKQQGQFVHARACDPVIADERYAYVTLREGKSCGPANNELHVIDIQNLQSPTLLRTYPMANPAGLSKDNNLLFICDGIGGLKVYDASNPQNLQMIKRISGVETYDVITYNNHAILVAKDGLYQYDYSNPANIHLISRITLSK